MCNILSFLFILNMFNVEFFLIGLIHHTSVLLFNTQCFCRSVELLNRFIIKILDWLEMSKLKLYYESFYFVMEILETYNYYEFVQCKELFVNTSCTIA